MKISFYSNFLTHHQLAFCEEMYKKYGDDFKFVSTEKINEERLSLGFKDMDSSYPYVLKAYESEEKHNEALELALNSDVVIMGSTETDEYAVERLKQDKLTFRYYARMFYKGIFSIFDFKNNKKLRERHFKYKKNKNMYLLCASSYSPNDFNRFGMYINKCFKWGYFPETRTYDEKELINGKNNEKIRILWAGRFIKEKHPEYAIKLVKKLKENGYKFDLQMLGNGYMFDRIKSLVEKYNLKDEVDLVGPVDSDKVRGYMEKANIYICTSSRWERWGVVLNEAMNSGCAVVANRKIGGVPFLINNGENGYGYKNFNDFYSKIVELIEDKEIREKMSINAYRTISKLWTAKNAVKNLELLINSIIEGKENPVKQGPGSNANKVIY